MPGRGTTDAIFAARQVIEKHREIQKALHLVFIDLEKEIQLQGETVKIVKSFTYLGSTLAEDGELDAEVTHRVQSGWKN